MSEYRLLWGDFHTHLDDLDNGDAILRDARENIDFAAVLCYPFVWDTKNGLRVESVRNRPEFLTWWERLRALARAHHDPGHFVTFLGYEWNGNRTHYGDHNVIYFDEDNPLDDAWSLEDLYANLRKTKAIAIPHHTGYLPNRRGKDWDVFDESLSPVMEIFSIHGSSEGCNTPLGMTSNTSMGPRTSGGTLHDALARGDRIGVIGSNDYVGLQGRWGIGRAALWATDCTRGAIWDAILARRTYAVTGDRIELDFQINGQPMGSVLQAAGTVDAEVRVVGSCAIDRIELLRNGRVIDTYCHSGRWEPPISPSKGLPLASSSPPLPLGEGRGEGTSLPLPLGEGRGEGVKGRPTRFKIFLEAGWGPCSTYGFKPTNNHWNCRLDLEGGRLVGVERCFSLFGQRVTSQDERHCAWQLVTAGRTVRNPFGMTQGIIVEIEGTPETRLHLRVDDMPIDLAIGELLRGGRLIPFFDESVQRVRESFGLDEAAVGNPDIYYHNARKVKIHQAIPEAAYRVSHTFRDLKLAAGRNAFYVRVSQLNGQVAWSSPIWVDAQTS